MLLPFAEQQLALFIDIDGTLIESQRRRRDFQLDSDLVFLLGRLQHLLGGAVAILSGRDLSDLDRLLSPLRLPAGALHGLQCRDSGGRVRLQTPKPDCAARVEKACASLARALPGVRLERKARIAFALHHRDAPGQALAVREGAEAMAELKPVGADKGDALHMLANLPPFRDRRPLVLGDGLTDEPAFVMAERLGGAGVIVGERRPTRARHALTSPRHTARWLAGLAAHLERTGTRQ